MLSLVLLLTALLARDSAPGRGSQQPTFRSGVELVEVDVTVSRGGTFVADLQPEEFTLFENGEPRAVQLVTLVTGAGLQVPDDAAAPRTPVDIVPLSPPGQIFVLFFDLDT